MGAQSGNSKELPQADVVLMSTHNMFFQTTKEKHLLITIRRKDNRLGTMTNLAIIQATPAMSTSRISILSLVSKWFFIPNLCSLYIFAFQLCLCWKRLTWSNRYLKVICSALDVFSIIFATAYVEVENRHLHGCRTVCFGYVHIISAKIFKTKIKNN